MRFSDFIEDCQQDDLVEQLKIMIFFNNPFIFEQTKAQNGNTFENEDTERNDDRSKKSSHKLPKVDKNAIQSYSEKIRNFCSVLTCGIVESTEMKKDVSVGSINDF